MNNNNKKTLKDEDENEFHTIAPKAGQLATNVSQLVMASLMQTPTPTHHLSASTGLGFRDQNLL